MPRKSRREQPDSEEAQRLERRSDPFTKTKMCKFHILGMCTRGSNCQFAHERSELNSLPDLYRTKLCKRLINTGSCDDPDCKYAHNREELRDHPVPRMDRSVRIGGHTGEDQTTHAGNANVAGMDKAGAPTRGRGVQNMPYRVSHEMVGQMGNRPEQFCSSWGAAQKQSGMYGAPPPMMTFTNGSAAPNQFSRQDMQPSSSSHKKKGKHRFGDSDQFMANNKLYGMTSAFQPDLSQYSTPPNSAHSEAANMVYSPERWPQSNLHFGSGSDCGFNSKGNNGGRSCSSDTDTKSGFGSDNSSVTQPPDHLLGGDQQRLEQNSCSEGRYVNGRFVNGNGQKSFDTACFLQALVQCQQSPNLRFENGQMMTMAMKPSIVQEAEVAAGLPYVPCQMATMNNMIMNCYVAQAQTPMQGGGYPMATQASTQVLGLAEILGAEDCSVKNTFLNFGESMPKLRNVQTAAGRLDCWGRNEPCAFGNGS